MKCSWTEHDSYESCDEDASLYRNLPLCEDHLETHKSHLVDQVGATARQSADYHELSSFPGKCYFVLLPDGNVKIGYSNTDELLAKRMGALARVYHAPVIPLCVIDGGFVAEAVMHHRFREDRLPGNGERFRYSPAMAEFIAGT